MPSVAVAKLMRPELVGRRPSWVWAAGDEYLAEGDEAAVLSDEAVVRAEEVRGQGWAKGCVDDAVCVRAAELAHGGDLRIEVECSGDGAAVPVEAAS
jgi:hypothetical protein